jgi:hypothetical protein
MEVIYHPFYVEWFANLLNVDVEVAGEVQALIDALEHFGRTLGEPESKLLSTSKMGLRELRRTPPSSVTPYADGPPIIRVLYGFVDRGVAGVAAVLLIGGEKKDSGPEWYQRNLGEAERRLTILIGQRSWRAVT